MYSAAAAAWHATVPHSRMHLRHHRDDQPCLIYRHVVSLVPL